MKKVIIGIMSVVVLLSMCTVFAYNSLPYHKDSGEIIRENVANHNFKSWDKEVFSQIKEDYEQEISGISKKRTSVEDKKRALENAEKIMDGLIEELYDQQPTSEEEIRMKKEQETYVKKELEKLGELHKELYPIDEYDEVLKEAINFKEQVLWERELYKDSSDEVSQKVYSILEKTVLDVEKLLEYVQSNSEITMNDFEKERTRILDERVNLEKEAGIKHLSEDEI